MRSVLKYSLLFLLIYLIVSGDSFPQRPEKVYSIVKQIKTFDWYKNAAIEWKKVIDENPSDAEAWLYYYTANRMARMFHPEEWEKTKGEYFREPNDIVSEAEKSIPGTFEYNYIKVYNNKKWDEEHDKLLFHTLSLGPDRPEIYDELIRHYEIKRDTVNSRIFNGKWYKSGDVSPGVLNWNYNVLASLEKDAILFTNGDNDTYPVWMLQYVKNFRKDVLVLNINLMMVDEYRNALFKQNSIKPFTVDFSKYKEEKNPLPGVMSELIKHVVNNSLNRPVYFALTLNSELYRDIREKVYMIGLAFKYSDNDFDNMAVLIKNYEHNWLLDYLIEDFTEDISVTVVNQININYLPVFAKLYEHFLISGNDSKTKKIKSLALHVAEKGKGMDLFNKLFEKE